MRILFFTSPPALGSSDFRCRFSDRITSISFIIWDITSSHRFLHHLFGFLLLWTFLSHPLPCFLLHCWLFRIDLQRICNMNYVYVVTVTNISPRRLKVSSFIGGVFWSDRIYRHLYWLSCRVLFHKPSLPQSPKVSLLLILLQLF